MQPGDPPLIAERLLGETRDILLAGHMPHLDRLLRHLLADPTPLPARFPLNGLVVVEQVETGWEERWRLDAE